MATSYKTVNLLDIQYDQSVRLVTVGENIIATIKMREKKNFNIAIAHLVIALISLLQFLYEICRLVHGFFFVCFPYSHSSSNYCDSNSCRTFTLLKALAKKMLILSLSPLRARKSDNFKKEDIKKEKKNWYQKGCKED